MSAGARTGRASPQIWDAYLTERDRAVFNAAGYGKRGDFPRRPALLLTGCEISEIESDHAPHTAPDAICQVARLARAARQAKLPVIHVVATTNPPSHDDVAPELAPVQSDIMLARHAPSAFFETDLMSFLNLLKADGIILAGGQTADAIRATAIDAFSLNMRSVIPIEACFDRWDSSHAISLFELQAKHAEVLPIAEIETVMHALPCGLFDLPAGDTKARRV
jgi:isochorismate hydrolase